MTKNEKIFKLLFWITTLIFFVIVSLIGVFFLASIGFSLSGNSTLSTDDTFALIILTICLATVILFLIILGILVFKDAKKHSLNPWMWLLITVYAPNGVGIIIYLIVRYNTKNTIKCPNCNYIVEANFKHCPNCGKDL